MRNSLTDNEGYGHVKSLRALGPPGRSEPSKTRHEDLLLAAEQNREAIERLWRKYHPFVLGMVICRFWSVPGYSEQSAEDSVNQKLWEILQPTHLTKLLAQENRDRLKFRGHLIKCCRNEYSDYLRKHRRMVLDGQSCDATRKGQNRACEGLTEEELENVFALWERLEEAAIAEVAAHKKFGAHHPLFSELIEYRHISLSESRATAIALAHGVEIEEVKNRKDYLVRSFQKSMKQLGEQLPDDDQALLKTYITKLESGSSNPFVRSPS